MKVRGEGEEVTQELKDADISYALKN